MTIARVETGSRAFQNPKARTPRSLPPPKTTGDIVVVGASETRNASSKKPRTFPGGLLQVVTP